MGLKISPKPKLLHSSLYSFYTKNTLFERLIEAENKNDVALLEEFISPNFVNGRNTPFEMRSLESYKKFEVTDVYQKKTKSAR